MELLESILRNCEKTKNRKCRMGQRYSRTPLFSAMGHYINNLMMRVVRQSEIYPELRKFGLRCHSRPAVAHIESLKTLISKNEKIVLEIFEFK